MAANYSQDTESGSIYSIGDNTLTISQPTSDSHRDHPNNDVPIPDCTDNMVTIPHDQKLARNTKITDEEWKAISITPAVQSCLEIFVDKAKVIAALNQIKMKQGRLTAYIKGDEIAEIIIQMEEDDNSASQGTSAISEIHVLDAGHQDDGSHEIQVSCEKCDIQGVKPVVKFKKENH